MQCSLYETVTVPAETPEIIEWAGMALPIRRAYSQWRLDFPLPDGPGPGDMFDNVLAVLEKILLRGSIVPLSPNVDAVLGEIIDGRTDVDPQEWLRAFEGAATLSGHYTPFDYFDSEEERRFYSRVLADLGPGMDMRRWTVPQISASAFARGSLDAGTRLRIDFLIAHPSGLKLVVEIDGDQHKTQRERDRQRDQALIAAGVDVLRIPASEIRSGGGAQLDRLASQLADLPDAPDSTIATSIEKALAYSKLAGQLQVALLEGIKSGHLPFEASCVWRLVVLPPTWADSGEIWSKVVKEAIGDLIALAEAICRLHTGVELKPEVEINHSATNDAHLTIAFGEVGAEEIRGAAFVISDIYLPVTLANTLPSASSEIRIKPDRDIVEYLLFHIFHKESFWPGQWDAVERALEGKDSIVLLPTGGGKTIAFQLASLLRPGPCLVVDPLIALIEDQLDNLRAVGMDRALGITSQMTADERRGALAAFAEGQYLFCYIAPERLQMEDFRESLRAVTVGTPVSLIAIDEAHCVSEWGHDFRTSYLNVGRNAREYCSRDGHVPPLLGLTGTASRSVLKDVQRELEITEFDAIVTPISFDRQELTFRVLHCRSSEKEARLRGHLAFLPSRFGATSHTFFQPNGKRTMGGLVFYPHVNGEFGIREGFHSLRKMIDAAAFYSGKPPKGIPDDQWDDIKSAYAGQFKHNEISLLICTNAFGMGIDKPNIRYTVHTNLPRSIEAFYQEAGRAGRDRAPSDCCLIISNDNPERTRRLLDPNTPLSEIAETLEKLPWGEQDDITRALHFHTNAFKGAEAEVAGIRAAIDELRDIQSRRTETIAYSRGSRNEREKAVHRLVILGVVDDYTVDYAHDQIKIRLSGADKEAILSSYLDYVRAYSSRQAQTEERKAEGFGNLYHREFVERLASQLVAFIYSTIELGRRRSLAEMLQAVSSGSTDREIRQRILNYLQLGTYSELLEAARERDSPLDELVAEIGEQIAAPNDAAELRGQTIRMLESYPDNPALLVIRALAELMCRDRDLDVVEANLIAGTRFALSESGWALGIDEVCAALATLAKIAVRIGLELGPAVVQAYLSIHDEPRDHARKLVTLLEPEISYPAATTLMAMLNGRLEILLHEGGDHG